MNEHPKYEQQMNEHPFHEQQIRAWLDADRKYIWHPFTQMKDYALRDHHLIVRGDGLFLEDAYGKRYFDTISSWWTNAHGHNHPRLQAALKKQIDTLDHVIFGGMTHPSAIECASALIELTPPRLQKVFFSDNGSTAVEVALKMSFQYWQHKGKLDKKTFVYLSGSYHGDTLGAVSVGGVEIYHHIFKPLLFHAIEAPAPQGDSKSSALQALEALEKILAEHSRSICGLILEPMVQAAGGMNIYHSDYLKGARALCDQHGIHLIADEVAVGFGRTGTLFACEHAGIEPDLLCLSKAITGGMLPLSVTLCTQEIYDEFYDDYATMKTFFHGHSYTANPLSTAVAAENLKMFAEPDTMLQVKRVSRYLGHTACERLSQSNHVSNLRHLGMIIAFDLKLDASKDLAYPPDLRIGYQVYLRGLDHGLILRPLGDTIYYWLPFCTTEQDVDEIITRTLRVLESL